MFMRLMFAADFRLGPISRVKKRQCVEKLIDQLGLTVSTVSSCNPLAWFYVHLICSLKIDLMIINSSSHEFTSKLLSNEGLNLSVFNMRIECKF